MQTKLIGLGMNCQLNYRLKMFSFTDMIVVERWRHWKYYIAETFRARTYLLRINNGYILIVIKIVMILCYALC